MNFVHDFCEPSSSQWRPPCASRPPTRRCRCRPCRRPRPTSPLHGIPRLRKRSACRRAQNIGGDRSCRPPPLASRRTDRPARSTSVMCRVDGLPQQLAVAVKGVGEPVAGARDDLTFHPRRLARTRRSKPVSTRCGLRQRPHILHQIDQLLFRQTRDGRVGRPASPPRSAEATALPRSPAFNGLDTKSRARIRLALFVEQGHAAGSRPVVAMAFVAGQD